MSKISASTTKKIGLFVAINMIIGSVIGVGIFFKNNNIFATNDHNAVGVLIAWIVSGLISFFTALSFAEVSSVDRSHSGLGGWCYHLIGKKMGNFVKTIQPFFYFALIAFSISIFCGEAILNIFSAGNSVHIVFVFLIGFSLFIFFSLIFFLSRRTSSYMQSFFTILKFIPLLMVLGGGIYSGVTNANNNLFITSPNTSSPNFINILVSLPSILFAFDSFVSVGNLSKDMNKPEKNVPLAVIISMLIVGIFYTLVSVGQLLSDSGDIYSLFDKIVPNSAKHIIKTIISVFICIAVLGVLNSFCIVSVLSCESLIEDRTIVYSRNIKSFSQRILGWTKRDFCSGLLISFTYYFFFFICILIPSAIFNTDAYVDGISNFPTIFFFALYATVILFGLINRKTKKVEVNKVKGFPFFGVIAMLGCYLVFFFQVFYTYTTAVFINPNGIVNWGLFSTHGYITYNWQASIVFFFYFIFMAIYFIINKVILSKQQSLLQDFKLEAKYA